MTSFQQGFPRGWRHYGKEFPNFREEVMPRLEKMGLRQPVASDRI